MEFDDALRVSHKLLKTGLFEDSNDVYWLIKTAERDWKDNLLEFYFNVNSEEETWEYSLNDIEVFNEVLSRVETEKDPWLRYSALPYASPDYVYPFQVDLERCAREELWRETKVSFTLWVFDEKNFTNRINTVDKWEMWDKIDVLFWDDTYTNGLDSFVTLLVHFVKAGVKSKSGWKWLLDGMFNDYLLRLQEGTFLLVSWEELIMSEVKKVGLENHPLFELVKRVRSSEVWVDLIYHKSEFDGEAEFYLTAVTALDLPVSKSQFELVNQFMSDEFRDEFAHYPDKAFTRLHNVRVGDVREKFKGLL
jgi:hypothetical protein